MKRVFGIAEAAFDLTYLCLGIFLSFFMLFQGKTLTGAAGAVLVLGDSFHLVPRIALIATQKEAYLRTWLGRGKQITSITMTLFYVLLWHWANQALGAGSTIWTAVLYSLALLRILLCFLPQNQWTAPQPGVRWAIIRNIPFFMIGLMTVIRFFIQRNAADHVLWLWLIVLLSFAFYLPVVLFSHLYPKVGMLMLPKTCMYVLLLCVLLSAPL